MTQGVGKPYVDDRQPRKFPEIFAVSSIADSAVPNREASKTTQDEEEYYSRTRSRKCPIWILAYFCSFDRPQNSTIATQGPLYRDLRPSPATHTTVNRYIMSPTSLPLSKLPSSTSHSTTLLDELERLVWPIVVLCRAGHHLNENVFPIHPELQNPIYPFVSPAAVKRTSTDGDLSSAVMISLVASSKTARTFAYFPTRGQDTADRLNRPKTFFNNLHARGEELCVSGAYSIEGGWEQRCRGQVSHEEASVYQGSKP
ncbi:uncharacterized protein N7482_008857 [Penicillium canariense]|uniref:Uncharacterized protein n=1 Tax=Penicillium canariense TaxID=189055 RepID=A0A9W9HUN6_9EURO|nr:uncharacterized protein N7482_008857 [Penicillium canariense]KAJ5157757.1 hypothetical protein N7482_008857 [Penicillium canariense]